MSPRIDYKAIAFEAVGLLCSLGFLGLDPSRQRELWQRALDLDRRLHPDRPPIVVWTEAEGDVDPPRKPGSTTPENRQPEGRTMTTKPCDCGPDDRCSDCTPADELADAIRIAVREIVKEGGS